MKNLYACEYCNIEPFQSKQECMTHELHCDKNPINKSVHKQIQPNHKVIPCTEPLCKGKGGWTGTDGFDWRQCLTCNGTGTLEVE
jgi:hypothetical protein